jgi:hypothetical protein
LEWPKTRKPSSRSASISKYVEGRVEQDQVDLEVQEIRDREEHLALDLGVAVEQEVHRAVEDLRI